MDVGLVYQNPSTGAWSARARRGCTATRSATRS
jgi:hypothetical protein